MRRARAAVIASARVLDNLIVRILLLPRPCAQLGSLDGNHPSVALCLAAGALIIFGHSVADQPLESIGKNAGAGYDTRIWGYDTLRGEFSLIATGCIFGPAVFLVTTSLEAPLGQDYPHRPEQFEPIRTLKSVVVS